MTIYEMTTKRPEDGNFKLEVLRTADAYKGQLRIINLDTGDVLTDHLVSLSWGAPFGPDVQDVADWEARFERFLNAP